jgi:cytochrome b involved in lipid metabolism
MSKETIFSIMGVIVVVALTIFYTVQYNDMTTKAAAQHTGTQTTTQAQAGTVLSAAEIAKHSGAQSCWLIISGKIYDATSYLNTHPDGVQRILEYCGSDATAAFDTKGGQGTHSAFAQNELASLYIGDLNGVMPNNIQTSGTQAQTPSQTQTQIPATTNTSATTSTITLTAAEVASHNSAQSCWFIISGKVYDVTTYPSLHPGGAARILAYCGQDATQAFATKGGQGTHSQNAANELATMYIGDLNAQINTPAANSTIASVPPTPPGWRDYEDDD